ncbi:MAG: acetyl-CoA carboxylase biotin carboxyl carrier protein [Acidobacteriota bacterium]
MTLDEIKRLLEFLREHEIAEFELDYENVKLRVKSASSHVPVPMVPAVSVLAAPAVTPVPVPGTAPSLSAPAGSPAPAVTEEGTELAIVKSPIVGTFYRSAEPGSPPLADIGRAVRKGDVLCIIEAMKLMNEIDSEYDGEVVSIYVENGQAVQYGERLFAIRLKA